MSLFPDPDYVWRETFFVCLPDAHRPTVTSMRSLMGELAFAFEELETETDADGRLDHFAAVVSGVGAGVTLAYLPPEVESDDGTIERLLADPSLFEAGDACPHRERLLQCDARIDVYHFERATLAAADRDDDVFDPGPVLSFLSRLAATCRGVAIDPQANAILA